MDKEDEHIINQSYGDLMEDEPEVKFNSQKGNCHDFRSQSVSNKKGDSSSNRLRVSQRKILDSKKNRKSAGDDEPNPEIGLKEDEIDSKVAKKNCDEDNKLSENKRSSEFIMMDEDDKISKSSPNFDEKKPKKEIENLRRSSIYKICVEDITNPNPAQRTSNLVEKDMISKTSEDIFQDADKSYNK